MLVTILVGVVWFLTLVGLFALLLRERTLRKRLQSRPDPVTDPTQARLRWAEWWMRNAMEYPDPNDRARVSMLRTCAELALLAENIEVLGDLLASLPESDLHGGVYNVAWQAGREVIATRRPGGQPPWALEASPEATAQAGHDVKLRRMRLKILFGRLRSGALTDDETGQLIAGLPPS